MPDPDGARSRCYVDAIVMGADNLTGIRAVGFYDDELVQTGHGWQIDAEVAIGDASGACPQFCVQE